MKTKMKMKNNRMLLALVMVAALAMVSVAGVAVIADDSDAVDNSFVPDLGKTTNMANSTTVVDGKNVYNVYLLTDAVGNMTATFSGTGTISLCSWDGTKFTPVATITFTGAGGYTVAIDAKGTTMAAPAPYTFTVYNTAADATPIAPTGAITVALGDVTFGKTSYAFDGKVTAGAATITSVGVAGTIVSVDATGNASMSGTVAANVTALGAATWDKKSYICTLTVEGKIDIGDVSATAKTLSIGAGVEFIVNGDVTMPAAEAVNTLNVTGSAGTDKSTYGTMTVNGTIKATAAAASITTVPALITITTAGQIQVNGTISGLISPITATTGVIATNAAYYQSGTPASYTYTTLANAMKASSDISITGKLSITEDTILTGNSTATPVSNKITVLANSILTIGSGEKYPVVSVPIATTVDIKSAGGIDVVGGKLQFEGMKTDVQTNVKAAVFMADATNGTYTDLATALGMAVSGNTVTLRDHANVSTTAEVKAGVILDATGKNGVKDIIINAGGKLVINGKLIDGGTITVNAKMDATTSPAVPAKAAGELVINSSSVEFTELVNSGIVTVGTEAKLKMTVLAITVGTDAVFNINGEFDFSGSFNEISGTTGSAATFNITGKMTITALTYTGSTAVDTTTFNVSGVLISNDDAMACEYLNVTGDGKVTVATGMTFIVNINMTIGTPSSGITASVNNATVKGVDLDTGASAVVYGTAANVDLKAYTVKTVFYFGDVVFATEYADGAGVAMVMPTVKLKDFNFLGWYNAPVGGAAVTGNNAGNIGGDYKSVYGYTTPMQYSLTLTYNQGASWILNGTVHSGVVSLTAGTYDLSVLVNDGYKGDAKITVTGDATYSNGKLTVTGDAAVSVSGVSVKDGGLDITEILLIILVVIIALLAIIVVFKMLRS